ncbi:MAG TPA: hypothetical protein VJH68_05565 [Candidatus Nanoarchaeia archaeon]|nr:hypothetical protein [Candidatus Nanoarchaeia archaeon]
MRSLILLMLLIVAGVFIIACSSELSSEMPLRLTPEEAKWANPEEPENLPQANRDEDLNAVYINNQELTRQQINELASSYGASPLPGRYWYDSLSGSYGIWHGPSLSVLLPGHDFWPLPEDASNGDTNLFINGRELPEADALFLEWIFAVPRQPGRYWQDALGNIGYENNPSILANLYVAYQERTRSSRFYGSGDNYWAGNFESYGNEQNGFGYVMVGGSSVSYGG